MLNYVERLIERALLLRSLLRALLSYIERSVGHSVDHSVDHSVEHYVDPYVERSVKLYWPIASHRPFCVNYTHIPVAPPGRASPPEWYTWVAYKLTIRAFSSWSFPVTCIPAIHCAAHWIAQVPNGERHKVTVWRNWCLHKACETAGVRCVTTHTVIGKQSLIWIKRSKRLAAVSLVEWTPAGALDGLANSVLKIV